MIKDFELGSKVSGACVDHEKNVEFCDENSNPDDFVEKSSVVQGNEPTKRQIVGADESDVAVCWEHPGVIEYDFSWND